MKLNLAYTLFVFSSVITHTEGCSDKQIKVYLNELNVEQIYISRVLAKIQSNTAHLSSSPSLSEHYKDLVQHLLQLASPHHPTVVHRPTLHQLLTEGAEFSETILELLESGDLHQRISLRDRVKLLVHVWSTRGGLRELREMCGEGLVEMGAGPSPDLDRVLSSFVKYKIYISFLLAYSCD
ncbi:hypothetical protein ACHWQZ_G006942 [Mnemiopsis leidyi]